MIVPAEKFITPAVIAGARNGDTFKFKSNSSRPSETLSLINAKLTLLKFIPLANVTVNAALLKSTPPVIKIF